MSDYKNTTVSAQIPDAAAQKITEARFQKLFEDADAMSIQGYLPDGTVIYWNRASENIYGYSAEEALGGNLLDLIIPEEMREDVRSAVAWMFESGEGIPPARLELRHKNGGKVPVYSSHTVVQVPGQMPVMFCMDADMRALDEAENELRIAASAFDIHQAIVISDPNGVILRINKAFTELTGYQHQEVAGKTARILRSDKHLPDFYSTLWQTLLETGSWQGEICNRRKNGEEYSDWVTLSAVRDLHGVITHFVATHTDTTQLRNAEATIANLAFYDPLTSLPNRRLLQERLAQAILSSQRTQSHAALLFIGVDHFKSINDTLGHATGDRLLQQVAGRLRDNLRECDTAARFGGDEFVVLLENLDSDLDKAIRAAEVAAIKLLEVLAGEYQLGSNRHQSSVSIGITLFPSAEMSVDALMRQADLAMFEAKGAGRNCLRFFDAGMQALATLRAELVSGLRDALVHQQFKLVYQPQVDFDGTIVGAEALLRWQRPGHGVVPPGDFINAAEESGLIQPIGHWVLETACKCLVAWAKQPALADLTLAVNVSASQFIRDDFVGLVKAVLISTGARPQRLKLELTESLLITQVDKAIEKMKALRAIGVSFSLDDFGTGYSSLSYLQRLPLDQLKIDRSFVHNLLNDNHSLVIVQMIIALGGSMGLSVIAEGVETPQQRQRLGELGCDAFQGFVFARPMGVEDFVRLASKGSL